MQNLRCITNSSECDVVTSHFVVGNTAGSYRDDHFPYPGLGYYCTLTIISAFNLSDYFSHSPQLGINPLLSAPPAVPHSSSLLRVATRGVGTVTPFEAPPTETPGMVLPMTQVDHPPPIR